MNLNQNTTAEQLKTILAECNDRHYGHLLYVKSDGNVRIKRFFEDNDYPIWVEDNPDDILLRFEYFNKGNNYVGVIAAQNEKWVRRIFEALQQYWLSKNLTYPDYIDVY